MPKTATLERDVADLRSKITAAKADKVTALKAADDLAEAEKAKGWTLADTSDAGREVFDRIDAAYKVADTHGENAAELERRLHRLLDNAAADAVDRGDGDPDHPALRRAASMGAVVLASTSYQKLIASGVIGQGREAVIVFDPVTVANKEATRRFLQSGSHAVFADAGDGTPLVPADERLIPPVSIPKRQPTLLDMINVQSTGRDAVTWARQTARTNNAATTAFGVALPKSRYTYETVTSPALRKGHHAVVDEGNVADQEEFQGIVDDELVTDLRLKIENDALNAAGGTDWTGIYQAAGIGDVDAAIDGDNLADSLHMAITTVRVSLEREPTAWGINPLDFEQYYLEKGTDGHYLHHRGPQETQVQTIWGLPAMVSTGYSAPLVGDFKAGATLWVREGIAIVVGRIDDQLLEGLLTIRAQTRAAFAVKQPLAFCTVSNFEPA